MDLESPHDKMNGVAGAGQQATQPQVRFDMRHGSGRSLTDKRQEVKDAGPAQERETVHVAGQSDPLAGSVPQALLGSGTYAA
jgi:hypothetical protein